MDYTKRTIFLWAAWLLWTGLAGARTVAMSEIPALKHLPVNAIHRIFQDSEGYMWYGTVDGLCRDDGYAVQVFRSDFNRPGLLRDNLVECIAEDGRGNLWFGTDRGAYRLDKADYSIHAVEHRLLGDRLVFQAYSTRDGSVWLSVTGHLLNFDADGRLLATYETRNGAQPTNLAGFCESRSGDIILTYSEGGVWRLRRGRGAARPEPFPDGGMRHRNPSAVVQDEEHDYFWMGTWGDGVVRFDPQAAPDSMFLYADELPRQAGRNNIFYLVQDRETKTLWATTTADLTVYDIASGRPEVCDAGHPELPRDVMLNEVIRDRAGCLWVSAFDYPSFILRFGGEPVEELSLPSLKERTAYNPAVMALSDAGQGRLWLFQEREGLFLYDLEAGRLSFYKDFAETRALPFGLVKLMQGSRTEGAVWVVPERSPRAWLLGSRDMRMTLLDTLSLPAAAGEDAICSLCEDETGARLWVGTRRSLYAYDRCAGSLTLVCDTVGRVAQMFPDGRDGRLWVATAEGGLCAVAADGTVERHPLPRTLTSLSRTSDGRLWMGTAEGELLAFRPRTGETEYYSRACELDGDMVNRVETDVFDHVWVATNQRIIEFNPRNGAYRIYRTTDGELRQWRFIPTAFCRDAEGRLLFGGIPGICRFTPSNLLEGEAAPARVRITDIRVDGRSLFFDENRRLGTDQVLRLSAGESNLVISFSTLNHRMAHKIRYAFRLRGIDRDWQRTPGGEHRAVYTHLPKGEYVFEVKATDENGRWSDEVTVLRLRREPVWYDTLWAWLVYVVLAAAVLAVAVRGYVRRERRRNDELWADSAEMVRMRNYLSRVADGAPEERDALDRLLVEKAVAVVEQNLAEPDFDVGKLAQRMNMSRSTLSRKLKAITGDTPLDFIRHIRMKHARRLLEERGRTVGEVAAALGYFNRKYFTACFKEEFGVTPSDYQKDCARVRDDARG